MPRFVAMLLAAIVVAPAHAQAIDPNLTSVAWRVIEIAGAPAAHAETLQFSEGKISAKTACNSYHASLRQAGAQLEIGKGRLTVMLCEKSKMAAQRRYLDAIGGVRSYVLADGTLSLVAADGRVLVKLTR
jgi:heat shock protein HslJ